jgi:putative membrane protein
MQILISLLVNTIAVLATGYILPGVDISNFLTAVLVAIVLGVLNTFIKPIFLLISLPINILTLGLFTLVINACIVLIAGRIVTGFYVENFLWALIFSIVLSLVSGFLNTLTKNK